MKKNKLIFTSYGLTTPIGRKLIGKELAKDERIKDKSIFLFHEPHKIETTLLEVCRSLGFRIENIILSSSQPSHEEILKCDYLYCTEGNTFEILHLLRERSIDKVLIKAFSLGGKVFIGASAGAMIAGTSVEEAISFDKNFVNMTDFTALSLFDGIVIPHYTKSELKRYIKNSPGIEKKYKKIYSVANDKNLVLEVK